MVDLLLLEIDQVFVVLEDLDVCEGSPSILDLLCCHSVLGLLGDLASTLLVASPGPLDLDCSDVVHCESMVLEESPRQRHLVGGLDKSSTEIAHTLLLILGHHIEGRRQELLSKALGRREVLHRCILVSSIDAVTHLTVLTSSFGLLNADQE